MNTKSIPFLFILLTAFRAVVAGQSVSDSGAFTYSYPIEIPDGTNGMQPSLSLEYNSQGGNGMLGMGWNLSGLQSISRDTSYPVNWDDADHFLLNGQRLISDSRTDDLFRTEYESFLKIEFKNSGSSTSYWVVTRKDGTQLFFGNTADSRIEAVGHETQARVWALNKVLDVHGNYYTVEYEEDSSGGDYYPVKMAYTQGNGLSAFHTVEFAYQDRTDHWGKYVPSKVDQYKRLESIIVRTNGNLVQTDLLAYEYGSSSGSSRLTAIQRYGNENTLLYQTSLDWLIDGNATLNLKLYDNNSFGADARTADNLNRFHSADLNGDGKADIWQPYNAPTGLRIHKWISKEDGSYDYSWYDNAGFAEDARTPDNLNRFQSADLNGDGRADIWQPYDAPTGLRIHKWISKEDGSYDYSWYENAGFAEDARTADNLNRFHSADLNGDGKADIWQPYNAPTGLRIHQWISKEDGSYDYSWYENTGFAVNARTADNLNRFQSADLNGDGRADIWQPYNAITGLRIHQWISKEDGSYDYSWYDNAGFGADARTPDNLNRFHSADLNGDGKADIWQPYNTITGLRIHQWISKGDSSYDYSWYDNSGFGADARTADNLNRFQSADLNGDGKADIWQPYNTISGLRIHKWISKDDGSYNYCWYDEVGFGADARTADSLNRFQSADLNGNGKADIWQPYNAISGLRIHKWISDIAMYNIITSITLPSGATISPTYTPAPQVPGAVDPTDSTYPNISNASALNLVTSLAITDGNGNTYTTAYDYHNGKFHTGVLTERQGLGFEWIKKTNPDGTYNINYYYQEDALHYAGAVKRSESYGSDGKLYGATENSYAVEEVLEAPSDYHPVNFVKKTDTYGYNFNGVTASDWDSMKGMSGILKTHQSYEYDGNGNLIRNFNENDISDPSDDVLAVTSYLQNSSNYIFAPEYKKVYSYPLEESSFNIGSLESSDNLAGSVDYYYDDLESYRGIGDYGHITKIVAHSGEGDQDKYPDKENEFTYDVYGNVKTIQDGRGNTKTFHYDPNYHSVVQSVENAFGQTVQTVGFDSLMRPKYVKDMNENYTWKTYDEFGRVIKISDGTSSGPATTLTQMTYSNTATAPGSPQWLKKETYLPENSNDYLEEYIYFDGLDRIIQEKHEDFNASGTVVWTTVDYHYELESGLMRISEPYESLYSDFSSSEWNSSRNETVYHMDEIGRIEQTDYFQGISEYIDYGIYDKTVLTYNTEDPEESLISYEVSEGRNNFSYIYPKGNYSPSSFANINKDNWLKRTSSSVGRDGFTLQEISAEDYDYNRSGNTIQVWNDNLGRKKSFNDPDMGIWLYTYDENGNMKSQIDAKGNILTLEYDELNRVKVKNGANITDYNYDGLTNDRSASDGKNHGNSVNGLLTSVSFYGDSYEEDYYYDFENDIYRISKTIDGRTRTYEKNLDEIGRMASEVLPGSDGESLTYGYNATGNLKELTNNLGFTYISELQYNIQGKIEGFTQGNGTVTDYTYNDKYSLTNINITGGQGLIADMDFSYDAYGNMKTKDFEDGFHNAYRETYTYDDLFRLSQAESVGLYGTKTYHYDSYNNMLSNDGKLYKYDGTNPEDGGPHAVQQIQNESGDTLKTYEYDANGNITKITGQSSVMIRAKGEGVVNKPPRMGLWINGQGPETTWNVTGEEYETYSWHGYIPPGSTVSVLFSNDNSDGGVDTNLYVDYISINAVVVQTESSEVTYDQGGYSSGCFDGTDTLPGQEEMNLTGALHYLVPSGADAITRVLQYDSENRLSTIQDNGIITATYQYDDMGQRIFKIENGVKTYYFFDNYEEEYDQATGDLLHTTTYYFANGQRVAQKKDGETSYYHTDHLGSAVRMTDEAGNITESVAYTPFGKVAWFSGKDVTSYTFTGQESDNTGFMYYNARYYDPDLGRFLQSDTSLDGMNRYTYCGNNPVIYTDPTGNFSLLAAVAIVGGYLGGVSENDGEWNPFKWDYTDKNTYLGAGTGAAAATAYVAGIAAIAVTGGGSLAASVAAGSILGGIMGGITAEKKGIDVGSPEFWAYVGTGTLIGGFAGAAGATLSGTSLVSGAFGTNMFTSGLDAAISGAASGFIGGFGYSWAFNGDGGLLTGDFLEALKSGGINAIYGAVLSGVVGTLHAVPHDPDKMSLVQKSFANGVDSIGNSIAGGSQKLSLSKALATASPHFWEGLMNSSIWMMNTPLISNSASLVNTVFMMETYQDPKDRLLTNISIASTNFLRFTADMLTFRTKDPDSYKRSDSILAPMVWHNKTNDSLF